MHTLFAGLWDSSVLDFLDHSTQIHKTLIFSRSQNKTSALKCPELMLLLCRMLETGAAHLLFCFIALAMCNPCMSCKLHLKFSLLVKPFCAFHLLVVFVTRNHPPKLTHPGKYTVSYFVHLWTSRTISL